MKRCLICGKDCKSGAGLAAHHRRAHPDFRGKNRRAIEGMIAEMERQERINVLDGARLQVLRSLADQLDIDPSNAQMWKTYNEAIEALVVTNDDDDDAFTKLLEAVNSRAPVGDKTQT